MKKTIIIFFVILVFGCQTKNEIIIDQNKTYRYKLKKIDEWTKSKKITLKGAYSIQYNEVIKENNKRFFKKR